MLSDIINFTKHSLCVLCASAVKQFYRRDAEGAELECQLFLSRCIVCYVGNSDNLTEKPKIGPDPAVRRPDYGFMEGKTALEAGQQVTFQADVV
jgi:hypothetical protein